MALFPGEQIQRIEFEQGKRQSSRSPSWQDPSSGATKHAAVLWQSSAIPDERHDDFERVGPHYRVRLGQRKDRAVFFAKLTFAHSAPNDRFPLFADHLPVLPTRVSSW
jgi:hypothetical protein